jgi:hypothetical protein
MVVVNINTLAALVHEAEAELSDAEARLARAQADVAELRAERDALQAVFRRRARSTNSSEQITMPQMTVVDMKTSPAASEWRSKARTDAVEQALAYLWGPGRAVGPAEIHAFLIKEGREDKKEYIHAALAHLSRKNRVHREGAARWAPGPASEDAEGPAGTGPSDDGTSIGREGGAGTHVETADIRDHDLRPVQGEDRDHDRGAPVVVGG